MRENEAVTKEENKELEVEEVNVYYNCYIPRLGCYVDCFTETPLITTSN